MKIYKHAVFIHCLWALALAGTWWLRSRSLTPVQPGEPPGVTARRMADRAGGVRADGAGPAGRTVAVDSSTGETVTWLDRWAGAHGIISPESMASAVTEALSDPDPVRGMRHFTHLLERLSAENAPSALAALKSHSGTRETAMWVNMLCTAWGAKDGAAALAGTTVRDDKEAAMAGWARANPAAAEQWLAGLPADTDNNERRGLQRSLVRGFARDNPQAAVDYITASGSNDRGDLIRAVAREQMARGIPTTAQWAATLADPEMRGPALETVARQYMQVDPASGAAWAAESAASPDMRQAVGRVADRIADKDVMEALKWTQQLPNGPGQEEAYQQVFSEWARKDPTASSQELLRMPAGQGRDNAIHSFAGSLVRESPEDAIVWATAIGDPELRLDTQIDVARKWNAASPDAARSWIAANLPPSAREKALAKD